MRSEDPFEPISDVSLVRYAQVCRELVRAGHGWRPGPASVLARHGLTSEGWEEIHRGWSARIRASQAVRAAFRELYARD